MGFFRGVYSRGWWGGCGLGFGLGGGCPVAIGVKKRIACVVIGVIFSPGRFVAIGVDFELGLAGLTF